MTYVVTENCIRCKYTDCVDVCPVDCFHEGERFLVIHPEVCIDCGVCVPECPVEAIVEADKLRPDQQQFVAINAEYASKWPVISAAQDALPDADEWADHPDKLSLVGDIA
jgi:ferredoxin